VAITSDVFSSRILVPLLAVTSTNCIIILQLEYVQTFFAERIVNEWNNLPKSVDFSTLSRFERLNGFDLATLGLS